MRLILADDDALVTSALKTILSSDKGIDIVAVAGNGNEAIELYNKYLPDICLFDIRMDGKSGLEAAEEILKSDANARILFLTTFSDDEYILKALSLGSAGYILKQDFDKIIPALHAVYAGQSILGGDIIQRIPGLISKEKTVDFSAFGLDNREREIISLVANGLSNREISDTLYLSEGTVRNYISLILDKLNLRDRTQLAIFYYKNRK